MCEDAGHGAERTPPLSGCRADLGSALHDALFLAARLVLDNSDGVLVGGVEGHKLLQRPVVPQGRIALVRLVQHHVDGLLAHNIGAQGAIHHGGIDVIPGHHQAGLLVHAELVEGQGACMSHEESRKPFSPTGVALLGKATLAGVHSEAPSVQSGLAAPGPLGAKLSVSSGQYNGWLTQALHVSSLGSCLRSQELSA